MRNQMLDSYRAVREAAKERQTANLKKGNERTPAPVGLFVAPREKADSDSPTKVRELRAKAAGTNKDYIGLVRQAAERSTGGVRAGGRQEKSD
jgi:hypothetical protein